MRPVFKYLAENNYTVLAPLLAGHGTSPEDCETKSWQDWNNSVNEAYSRLAGKCDSVLVVGLSMGGLLTLELAATRPKSLAGIVLLATPLFLPTWIEWAVPIIRYSWLRPFYRYQPKSLADIRDPEARSNYWSYKKIPVSSVHQLLELQKRVRAHLNQVNAPALIMHARDDRTAPYASMEAIAKELGSTRIETVTLTQSQHIVTLDWDKEWVIKKIHDFLISLDSISQ
jgi:carboxylesterase